MIESKRSGGKRSKPSFRTSRGIWVKEEPKRPRGRPRKTTTRKVSTTKTKSTSKPPKRTSRGIWVKEEPKRPRGRPRKTTTRKVSTTVQPKRPRGRPRKTTTRKVSTTVQPKRPRGRPRKTTTRKVSITVQPKRPRGRPRKTTTLKVSTTKTKSTSKPPKRTSRGMWVSSQPRSVVYLTGNKSTNTDKEIRVFEKENKKKQTEIQAKVQSKPMVILNAPKTNKINNAALNKTLKQIDKEIVKVLNYYIVDIDKKELVSIIDYLMPKIKDIVVENMESNQKIVYKKFSSQVENKIVRAFQSINFVKHVCYDHNSKSDHMNLIVIHDHKSDSTAFNTIYGIVNNLNFYFRRLYIDVDTISISDIKDGTNFLKHTTTLLTR